MTDEEVRKQVNTAYGEAKEILQQNKDSLVGAIIIVSGNTKNN